VDAGVFEGGEVTVHYDPMVAKLIAWGENREAARRRAIAALRNYPILGIRTNTAMLLALLEHPRFVSGDLDTAFLDSEGEAIRASLAIDTPAEAIVVAQAAENGGGALPGDAHAAPSTADPWSTLRGWRG